MKSEPIDLTSDEVVSSTPARAIGVRTMPSVDPMERGETNRATSAPLSTVVYALAMVAFAVHIGFSGRFGYFRDELYYAACGQHLAWGYVDHAPLAPFLARLSRALLGDSLVALRFSLALAAAAKVILGG
jgi:hypothetical protein